MKKRKILIIGIVVTILLVAIAVSTFAYFTAISSGTSRVNIETKTASMAQISVGNNDTVSLTILPEDMLEEKAGTYKESTDEESGDLYANVTAGSNNGQKCTVNVTYKADSGYLFNRSHYCSKDGETNTYGETCATGYTMNTAEDMEYAIYLTPSLIPSNDAGYLDGGAELIDISDINTTEETIIKSYIWTLPAGVQQQTLNINAKARFYNIDFDQNSNSDKTLTGNISMSVYCVGESDPLQATLTKLNLSTADIISTAPTYTTNADSSTSGLYEIRDEYGTSLVFRGIVANNWAKFGTESISTNCTYNSKDLRAADNSPITNESTCTTGFTYYCTSGNTVFGGSSETITMCTNLGLSVTNGTITGTYNATATTVSKDMYWRVVRINGDKSLRMIYSGNYAPKTDQTVMAGTWTQIGTTAFNTNNNKNAYVGYMYGNSAGETASEVHANTNSSTIKTTIDNWYTNKTNLSTISSMISDSYFCYDRNIYTTGTINNIDYTSGTGIGSVATAYGAAGRLISSSETWSMKKGATPSLYCSQENDLYTSASYVINGKTSISTNKKIGLLSVDELVISGLTTSNNTTSYLYTGQGYWLASPSVFTSSKANVFNVSSTGNLVNSSVDTELGVRPVINIIASNAISGNGTAATPWVFSISNS